MPKFSGDFPKIPKYLIFHKLSNESLFCTVWVSVRTNTVTKKFNWDLPEQRTFISVASTLIQFKFYNRFTRFLQGSLILLQRASELILHAATRQRKYKRPQDCLRIIIIMVFLTEWELKNEELMFKIPTAVTASLEAYGLECLKLVSTDFQTALS